MTNPGLLAIWSDIQAANETDYLHWLTREHVPERVGIEGFRIGRVFRALRPDARRYFITYDLDRPDVVGSEAYLARLNSPTPWSQRIMTTLSNFARGGGRVTASAGRGWGGVLAALRVDELGPGGQDPAALRGLTSALAERDRIASVRLLEVDQSATTIVTREKSIRSGDTSFGAVLFVEGLDAEAIRSAIASIDAAAALAGGEIPLYESVFSLRKGEEQ